MDTSNSQSGRCLCGAVTVKVTTEEPGLQACHCEMCRRWTGSALMALQVAQDALTFSGPVKTRTSSGWAERSWCDTCGSTLWYKVTIPGHETYHVAAGLFDDAAGGVLDSEIYIDVKPGGYAFAGDHDRKTKAEIEAMFASFGQENDQ